MLAQGTEHRRIEASANKERGWHQSSGRCLLDGGRDKRLSDMLNWIFGVGNSQLGLDEASMEKGGTVSQHSPPTYASLCASPTRSKWCAAVLLRQARAEHIKRNGRAFGGGEARTR